MRPQILAAGMLASIITFLQLAERAAEAAPAPLNADERRLSLQAPKAGRARPLIVAGNMGAETTDVTIPYGVLKESGVATVGMEYDQPVLRPH
jgi:hypothetical protein